MGEFIFAGPSSPGFQNPDATFPTIYDQLQLNGYTNKKLFSIWLNDQSAKKGSILFGGIDSTKYRGKLHSLPVILQNNIFTFWAVNLTSVTYTNCSSSSSGRGAKTHKALLTPSDFEITTILDTGSPNMYLPSSLAEKIYLRTNAVLRMDVVTKKGTPYVPCALRQSPESLEFGFGGSTTRRGHDKFKITVPYSEIIYPYGLPANMGKVNADDGSPLCYLGLIGTEGEIFLLGDTFIRSAYVVYDVDHLQVLMAPVKYDK